MRIYVLEPGANQFVSTVVYERDRSAMALAGPGTIDWSAVFQGARWFHITGITPALSESAAGMVLEALDRARKAGVTISCDLNYRKNLWKWGKQAVEIMPHVVRLADFLIANEEDVQMTLGIGAAVDVHSGKLDLGAYERLTKAVLGAYSNLRGMAVTLRESGSGSHNGWSACWNDGREFLVSRGYEITHIVDRVGGGDSFSGGLIYGLTRLEGPREALEFAVALSCLKHSVPGDFSRVSFEEVNALLKDGGSGRVQR
jgi:2-dehydro-3-deoxygluconokinase